MLAEVKSGVASPPDQDLVELAVCSQSVPRYLDQELQAGVLELIPFRLRSATDHRGVRHLVLVFPMAHRSRWHLACSRRSRR